MSKIHMVKNLKPTIITLSDDVVLMPGLNKVDSKVVEKESFKKSAKLYLENSYIEMVSYEAEEGSSGTSLKDLKAKDAIKVVNESFDVEVLSSWLEVETREGVKKAIKKQLADIDKTLEKKD